MSSKLTELKINAATKGNSYSAYIGKGLLQNLKDLVSLQGYSKIAVITDPLVSSYWLEPLLSCLQESFDSQNIHSIEIPLGESHKTLKSAEKIWQFLMSNSFDRHSLVLNLGGGLIGDLGGFCARSYMRGIDFIQIPTSLLAQVDASIGSKLGVNFLDAKNSIGCFNHPKAVIIDLNCLESLEDRHFRAGLAEIYKAGLIADASLCELMQANCSSYSSCTQLEELVTRACEIKRAIVEEDPRESGKRKLLNLGHTAGHAIESAFMRWDSPLLHGEAVALGLVVAARLSKQNGRITTEDCQQIESQIKQLGLPTSLPLESDLESILRYLQYDKKNYAKENRWVLLDGIGKSSWDQVLDGEQVEEAIQSLIATENPPL